MPSSRSAPVCARTCCGSTPPWIRAGARHPQRGRHRRVVFGRAGDAPGRCWPSSGSIRTGRSWRSSDVSPGRRASATCWPPRTNSAPTRSWCCAPALPTPRRSPTKYAPRWPNWPAARTGVFWVQEMLPVGELREILSAATVFVCSSVYEPLGIVNLEAMACATAVVASDVGGIPEVVVDGVTGSLVHYDADDPTDIRPDWLKRSMSSSPTPRKPSVTGAPDASAASRNSPGRRSPSRRWRSTERCVSSVDDPTPSVWGHLAGDALEFVAQGGGFVGRQLDDKTTTTFKWYPHYDAAPLLGCFQGTVSGPGLHRRHRVLPPDSSWTRPREPGRRRASPASGFPAIPDIELPNHSPIVPYSGSPNAQDPSLGPSPGLWRRFARPGCAPPHRGEGTQQSRTWSSTIPVACISA